MADATVDVRKEGLVELLLDLQTMAAWEVLRRSGRALTLGELSDRTGLPSALVQAALDRLESFDLLQRMPARGKRRVSRYAAAYDRIAIVGDVGDVEQSRLFRDYFERFARRTELMLNTESMVELPLAAGDCSNFLSEPVSLTDSELMGLQRRVGALVNYVRMIQNRRVGRHAGSTEACNYYAHFRVHPLRRAILPQPDIVVQARGGKGRRSVHEDREWRALSPREREVAMHLGAGQTQPEIARELDLSPHTIGTLTRRLYAKLRVRRRADLVNKLRALELGGVPADRPDGE